MGGVSSADPVCEHLHFYIDQQWLSFLFPDGDGWARIKNSCWAIGAIPLAKMVPNAVKSFVRSNTQYRKQCWDAARDWPFRRPLVAVSIPLIIPTIKPRGPGRQEPPPHLLQHTLWTSHEW